jgi:hypothetical protein
MNTRYASPVMKVPQRYTPCNPRLLLGLAGILLLAAASLPCRGATGPQRLPLEDLGFQPLNTEFLLNGSSMLTLHYVDDKHLLVTFNVRRLMPRLPDDPEDDQDRNIDAVLLEVPTGHILARTSWRTHDHGQYLWSLGHGHFLLRIRDTLTTFAPLANLASGQPFAQRPFLTSAQRRIAAIVLSPDADLLMVETVEPTPPASRPATPLFGPTQPAPSSPELKIRNFVQINFYRLSEDVDFKASYAGVARSRHTGDIPANSSGYLATIDQGHQHWAFDFHSYTGRVDELSPFDSTCPPAPVFVNRSEFIAFGCHLGHDMHVIGGFNMRGEEMWEQNLFGDYLAPSLVFAPSTGRFALSRILARASLIPDQPISSDLISSQTVVVYQSSSGKQILRVDCSPIERAGQNFALSPDGLSLAVIHADAIEIYSLPPLTSKEQATLKLAQSSSPKDSDLPVSLTDRSASSSDADSASQLQPSTPAKDPAGASSGATALPVGSAEQPPTQPATSAAGDTSPEQPRKPPTLYTLPSDKPDEQGQQASPSTPQ